MEKTVFTYNAALKDVRLNDIPYRLPDGKYKWSQGQLDKLSSTEHNKIRIGWNKLQQLKGQYTNILKEMLVYESASEQLKTESDEIVTKYKQLDAEAKATTEKLCSELKQFEDGMANRGIIFESKPAESKKEISFINRIFTAGTGKKIKSVLFFFISWFVGEIFMTAVSWQTLRNDNNIESIVIRSMALGMVIFLIHVAGHLNKRQKKPVYIIFISFSLLMLLSMLFVPMIINKIYPENVSQPNTTQWSLSDSDTTTTPVTRIPILVEIYRGNEITVPAILCLIFFIAIMALSTINKEEGKDEKKEEDTDIEGTEINRHRNQLITQINKSIKQEQELNDKQNEEKRKNESELNNILKKLEENDKTANEIDKQITELKTNIEIQLVLIEKDLNQYKIDFEDILRNDEIKSSFVTPEWNNRQDILNFYKIK